MRRSETIGRVAVAAAVAATIAALIVATPAPAFETFAAPAGAPVRVASTVIAAAGHSCPRVRRASRRAAGDIVATCSNGERYRIFGIRGAADPVALSCSAYRRVIGRDGC